MQPKTISRGLLAAAVLLAAPAFGQDSPGVAQSTSSGTVVKGKAPVAKEILKVRFPKPKSFKLGNGVTVYVLEDHRLPAVRFRLIFRAGSLFEAKPGVAGMTASMLTEGTKKHTYLELAEETEGQGIQLNATSGADTASVGVAGLSETTDTLLALLSEVLLTPTFPADRLDRLKYAQTSQTGQRRSNPAALVGELTSRVYYGGTPYGRTSPTPEQTNAITREDLAAYHAAFYRPNGALLGVSGDVDMKTLRKKLEAALADWKPADKTPELPKADIKPKDATKVFIVDRPGSAQTVLSFGNISVTRTDPDYIPLVVANHILGGGSAARLFQNIREQKGYTYGAYSSLSARKWPGIWGANANVRTEVTEPAAKEFFVEFDRLQDEPVSEQELDRAKRAIVGSFARTLESPEGILGRSMELVQAGLPADYWDTYPDRIQAVTPEDIQRVAAKYLGKGRMQVIAVGERKKIEAGLAKLGPVEIVDPATLTGGGRGGGRRGG